MKRNLLSTRAVQSAGIGWHPDGSGLYLQVTPGGKSWVLRYKMHGRERYMGLGPLALVTLAEARQKTLDARKLKLDGVDPLGHRNAERAAKKLEQAKSMTFDQCRDAYIKAHSTAWKNAKHAAQWTSTLATYASPIIGNLPVQSIDTGLVMQVLAQPKVQPSLWLWTTKNETAGRLRGRIEKILGWATTSGFRSGDNPAKWHGHLENLLARPSKVKRVEHHPALPYAEVPAFIIELRQLEGLAARALEFTILTAARTGEIIGASWSEFDLDKKTWTLSAERMKAGKEHKVPLCERAVEILRSLPRNGEKPFGRSNMAMAAVLKRMGRDDITVHGFRSSFRDWGADCTNYPSEVCEASLAHAVSDQTIAAYKRTDFFERRRALMADWAAHCAGTKVEGNVIELRRPA